MHLSNKEVLGAGLEPACLSAYAPQTYVSAIPPPELTAASVKLSAFSSGLQVALVFPAVLALPFGQNLGYV